MKVYLVEDAYNAPGRILAVFRKEDVAIKFADNYKYPANVCERTIWTKQPPEPGYNE